MATSFFAARIPDSFHHLGQKEWRERERYPDAESYCPPGAVTKRRPSGAERRFVAEAPVKRSNDIRVRSRARRIVACRGVGRGGRLARAVQSCRSMSRFSLFLLPALAVGCLQPADGYVMVDERFEDCVECRWSVDGRIEQVTTVHPAEHGLHFLETTAMSLPINITIQDELSDGHWLEYSTNCGGAPEIWTAPGVGGWQVLARIPMVADAAPGAFDRVYGNLPPIGRDLYETITMTSLTLIVESPSGPCAIDNLRLVQPEPEEGW